MRWRISHGISSDLVFCFLGLVILVSARRYQLCSLVVLLCPLANRERQRLEKSQRFVTSLRSFTRGPEVKRLVRRSLLSPTATLLVRRAGGELGADTLRTSASRLRPSLPAVGRAAMPPILSARHRPARSTGRGDFLPTRAGARE